ncbi:MAG: SpoIIE family protein phosphatase [Lentisphaeria bacterium]
MNEPHPHHPLPPHPAPPFLELGTHQAPKHGHPVCGDAVFRRRLRVSGRTLCVLADGLGSGVKANVLSTLTGAMALTFVSEDMDIEQAARVIMDTLPVCRERGLGYSTFTILDASPDGRLRVIEHDNPPALLLHSDGAVVPLHKQPLRVPPPADGNGEGCTLLACDVRTHENDRLILVSDGVTQAGMGRPGTPLGWGLGALHAFIRNLVTAVPTMAARDLARRVVEEAVRRDGGQPRDDTSCAVLYVRRPRRLLVVTGPPFVRENDRLLADSIVHFPGEVAICGGTTAVIAARELHRPLTADLEHLDEDLPPLAIMPGIALVCEGAITLQKLLERLERAGDPTAGPVNSVTRLAGLLLDSDIIEFVVGARVNDAHLDPSAPFELDLRRNIVRRLQNVLETRHLKETAVRYL